MLSNRLYYHFKPYLPWRFRMVLRRALAKRKLRSCGNVWPINEAAGRQPQDWPGWPDGKKFAFVLTHDVEDSEALAKCHPLMQIEQRLGFRSSFNFVPEGTYSVPKQLRDDLDTHGFEVGVHDLKHDGKLYSSRDNFRKNAAQINRYLREWGAVGFRSGFMHHNLEWLQDLDVNYDASTFDTDPFEPQPDGVNTIFPFWVPRTQKSSPSSTSDLGHRTLDSRNGYVELPYTLPQDSTLFLILGERTNSIWRKKIDWIVERGGMALMDTHPDYMNFNNQSSVWEYPVSLYQEFLEYVQSKYQGSFWHATPREVAEYVRSTVKDRKPSRSVVAVNGHRRSGAKIWIDLDNTPHVPFFEPIVEELSRRGYEILLTARDAFQVCELAEQKGMSCLKIGRHHGKNKFRKVAGLFFRAMQLAPVVLREKPALAVSHGARSQIILSNLLGIPTVLLADYEFAKYPPLMRPTWEMVPDVIPDSALYCAGNRIRKYPGIKEDVYVSKLKPDPALLKLLGLDPDHIVITARPPATEAHYHNPESEILFTRFMDRACRTEEVRTILLPRNKAQGEFMLKHSPHWFEKRRTMIPDNAIDGLNLLWHSDLVISGGGTMNREAAALGVPVYSIFRGKTGAVDHQLQKERRLIMVETVKDVDQIALTRRSRNHANGAAHPPALSKIVDHIEEVIRFYSHA